MLTNRQERLRLAKWLREQSAIVEQFIRTSSTQPKFSTGICQLAVCSGFRLVQIQDVLWEIGFFDPGEYVARCGDWGHLRRFLLLFMAEWLETYPDGPPELSDSTQYFC